MNKCKKCHEKYVVIRDGEKIEDNILTNQKVDLTKKSILDDKRRNLLSKEIKLCRRK